MMPSNQLEKVRQAIKTLESFDESSTEPFRIVIITLKQKETALEKIVAQSNH